MRSLPSRCIIALAFVGACAIAWGQTVPRDLRTAAAATYVGACDRCTTVSTTTCPILVGGNRSACSDTYVVADRSGDRYVHLGNMACDDDEDCLDTCDEECKTSKP